MKEILARIVGLKSKPQLTKVFGGEAKPQNAHFFQYKE